MTRRKWTEADDANLRRFHAEGKDDASIAYILGRAHSGVHRHRKALGLKANGTPGPVRGTYRHPAEVRAKIRAAQIKRWQTDEEYRQACVEALARGRQTNQAKRWHVPTDPASLRHYKKMRALMGGKFARAAMGDAR